MERLIELMPNQIPSKAITKVPAELIIKDPQLRLSLLAQIVSR